MFHKCCHFFTVCYLSSEVTDRRTCDCHLTYRHLTFFFDFDSQIYKLPKYRFPSLFTRLMCFQPATNWREILKLSILFIEKMVPKQSTFRHANFASMFDCQFLWYCNMIGSANFSRLVIVTLTARCQFRCQSLPSYEVTHR